jgi:hypothetical protein
MAAAPSVSTKGFAFFAFRRRLVVVVLCVCVRIDKKLGCGGERATQESFLNILGCTVSPLIITPLYKKLRRKNLSDFCIFLKLENKLPLFLCFQA